MKPGRPLKVLIAEDHPLFAMAIQQTLGPDYAVVRTVSDGMDALAAAGKHEAEFVLLDLSLPRLSGTALIRSIALADPEARILVVNGTYSPNLAARSLASGAHGFVAKTEGPDALRDALRRVGRGEGGIIAAGAQGQVAERSSPRDPRISALSPRLRQVLALLGAGMKTKGVARALGISPRTVEKHRSTLCRAMGVEGLADLYRVALAYAESEDGQEVLAEIRPRGPGSSTSAPGRGIDRKDR